MGQECRLQDRESHGVFHYVRISYAKLNNLFLHMITFHS
jgi:hypothetical protein